MNCSKMRSAMRQLHGSDIACKNVDCDGRAAEPHHEHCQQRLESSSGSNTGLVFDVNAVFGSSSDVTWHDGGFKAIEEFKRHTLKTVSSPSAEARGTLTSRTPTSKLRGCEGDNLMKAFVERLPRGTGFLDGEGSHRSGTARLEFLLSLSDRAMHTPEFVLTICNTFERRRPVSAS